MQAKAAKPRTTSPAPLRRSNTSKGASFHITSESIAADLAAFRKQGGRIEVLGNTRVLTRIEEAAKEDGKKPGK